MEEQERWAIHVDGIAITGFNSQKEANDEIDKKPEFKGKGAAATKLYGSPPKVVDQ